MLIDITGIRKRQIAMQNGGVGSLETHNSARSPQNLD
jgi:hypothetical protein